MVNVKLSLRLKKTIDDIVTFTVKSEKRSNDKPRKIIEIELDENKIKDVRSVTNLLIWNQVIEDSIVLSNVGINSMQQNQHCIVEDTLHSIGYVSVGCIIGKVESSVMVVANLNSKKHL